YPRKVHCKRRAEAAPRAPGRATGARSSSDFDCTPRADRRVDRLDDTQISQALGTRDLRLAVLEDATREIVDLGSELIDRGKCQCAAARRAANSGVVERRLETEPAALRERAKLVQAVRVIRRRAVADHA